MQSPAKNYTGSLAIIGLIIVSALSIAGFSYMAVNPRIITQVQYNTLWSYSTFTVTSSTMSTTTSTLTTTTTSSYGLYSAGCLNYPCYGYQNTATLYGYLQTGSGNCLLFQVNGFTYSLDNVPLNHPYGYVTITGYYETYNSNYCNAPNGAIYVYSISQ